MHKQLLTVGLLLLSFVMAVEPVNDANFNVEASFDLSELTLENFYDVLVPLAQEQGSFVFYDFTESFSPFFNDTVIPRFEEAYGIDVEYFSVDSGNAVQQLIAARQAGRSSPADVFFIGNGSVQTASEAGIIANLPLHTMLPSAQDLEMGAATVSRGFEHGGIVVPFHRNQTAIGYDTRFVSEEDAPQTLEQLLTLAQQNPDFVAITAPNRGGSGSGFLESVILSNTNDDCQERLYDFTVDEAYATDWAAGTCMDSVVAYFEALAESVEFTNGNSDTLQLIANGAHHVGTVWEDMAYDFINRGLLPPTVQFLLLEDGQVGDGDGVMIPSGTENLAAALLFTDFLLSDEIQLVKLSLNGSRSARQTLDVEGTLTDEQLSRLVPSEDYANHSLPRINGLITNAARDRIVADVIQNE